MDISKPPWLFVSVFLISVLFPLQVFEVTPFREGIGLVSNHIVIEDNSFLGISSPSEERIYGYFSLTQREMIRLVNEECPELLDIVFCESTFRPTICSYKGCEYGMGLTGIIPSTLEYCEEKLGRELDPFNPRDNLDCSKWLLENEGLRHWEASRACWSKRSFTLKK